MATWRASVCQSPAGSSSQSKRGMRASRRRSWRGNRGSRSSSTMLRRRRTSRVSGPKAGEEATRGYGIAGWGIAAAAGGQDEQTGESGCLAGAEQGRGALVLLRLVFRRGCGVADVFIGQAQDDGGAGFPPDGPTGGGGGFHRNGRQGEGAQSRPGDGYQGREDAGRQKAGRPDHLDGLGQGVAVQRFHGARDGTIQGGFLTAVFAFWHGLARFGTPAIVVEDGAPILGAAGLSRAGHGIRGEANAIGVAPVVGDGFAAHFDLGSGVGLELAAVQKASGAKPSPTT